MGYWFNFGSARFLIKSWKPSEILSIRDEVVSRKLTETEGLQKLFNLALAGFEGIPAENRISRREKWEALFQDLEIRTFVLMKAYELLLGDLLTVERLGNAFEKWLFITGRLKS